jgi:hypothetical protein
MKTKIVLLLMLCVNIIFAQDKQKKELSDAEKKELQQLVVDKRDKKNDKAFKDGDIYNPINFTTIYERMPKTNGWDSGYKISNRSSLDYIKRESHIHLMFDREFVEKLYNSGNLSLVVTAYIERKDKTIKPLGILGFTDVEVKSTSQNVENAKQGVTGVTNIDYSYEIKPKRTNDKSYSGEINLAWEDISEDDKIVIHVKNTAVNDVGFTTVLITDDFGWKQNPTGGLSFVKIAEKGFTEFTPAGTLGYSFYYRQRKSEFFITKFLTPSFGPVIHVFQNNENTTIGAGVFLSTIYNMVSFGGGWTINGVNHGKPYFSIGLNFIESYNTIKSLLNK